MNRRDFFKVALAAPVLGLGDWEEEPAKGLEFEIDLAGSTKTDTCTYYKIYWSDGGSEGWREVL